MELNDIWESRVKSGGADFVYFVDLTEFLSNDTVGEYHCAVLFGEALSKKYISDIYAGNEPEHKEILNTERKMDTLSVKIADELNAAGYKSTGKLKTGVFPHKTAALRAGLGFIGKNNLLITEKYGCALMLGKVLTTAPFETTCHAPALPSCGECNACVDACPNGALLGKTWTIDTVREQIITRKLCTLCQRCMVFCPYTGRYISQ